MTDMSANEENSDLLYIDGPPPLSTVMLLVTLSIEPWDSCKYLLMFEIFCFDLARGGKHDASNM